MIFFICYYCYSYDVYDIEGKLLLLLLLLFLLLLFLLLLLILLLISSRSYFLSCFGTKIDKMFPIRHRTNKMQGWQQVAFSLVTYKHTK